MSVTFNPFTGRFDFVGAASAATPNFSYKEVPEGTSVNIPENQQMIFDGPLLVKGDLLVSGDAIDISGRGADGTCFFNEVENNFTVPAKRLLLYKRNLLITGNLRVLGDCMEL
jgi:hypothetical protein